MFAPLLVAVATASLANAANTISNYHVHGSVVFVRTGERTPSLKPGTQILTALGAQQMYHLGQNFRTRYINEIDGPAGLGIQQIPGMSPDILNPDQMLIQTIDMPYLASAAQAFMQGLYPPYAIINGTGPLADRTGLLANGTAIDFPMNGYQYGRVQTVGQYDPQSIYIAGNLNCPGSQREAMMYFTTDEFRQTKAENKDFYAALDLDWFEGNLKEEELDYSYALEIYDYLEYAIMHNPDARDRLLNDTTMAGVYDKLRNLANMEAWYLWGNTSSDTASGYQHAIAGKTLAALILGQFQKIVDNQGNVTNGRSDPITFLFGEQDPMISLFSLMEVSYSTTRFHGIPSFASSIVLELFTAGSNTSFPSNLEDLWVRFGFINGTDYGGNITAYPMFRNGPSIEINWPEFQDRMSRIMTNTVADWCDGCNSYSLFCTGVDGSGLTIISGNGKNQKGKVSPTVAGVIGAIVTLAVAGLLFAAAMLLGGVRFHRVARGKKSELGGFKGSAKLASDADLSLPKNAVAPAGIVSFGAGDSKDAKRGHERVGSWELRQKEFGPQSGDLGDESRRASFDAIDETVARPVQPHERI